ncbi:HPr family phosphocarrier protein [Salipaludibacillus sp. HK11]|uniref:HPr family phosphocarrier protein n=1 Tax=Salipaludibacillus sp. HK11 TaxID=3394320 RepID=UPI0039FC2FC3
MLKQDFQLKERINMSNVMAFVHVSSLYKSDVYFLKNNIAYNSKCVLGLVNAMKDMKKDAVITVQAQGDDANEAISHLSQLFKGDSTEASQQFKGH